MQLLNIRKYGFLFILALSTALIVVSCTSTEEPGGECTTTGITYDNYAKEFMKNNCVNSGCHDVATDAADGIGHYETYEATKTVVDLGRMKGAINHMDGFSKMPKGGAKLDQCDIDKLSAWIDAGAPE